MRNFTLRICAMAWILSMPVFAAPNLKMDYRVDVSRFDADSFYVNLDVAGIKSDSIVFQFASTAPGTYQIMNVGRFVGAFKASDASGTALTSYRLGENQYVIRDARALARISYRVDDSYGTTHKEHLIYPMCGSNLERDNAQINGQMVFGFFKGFQSNPIRVSFNYPSDWKIGSLLENQNGWYLADTYDRLVDSPFLFGKLTHTTTKVGGADVHIYCYSQNQVITADSLLLSMSEMLRAAEKFLGKLPVNRYTFLYHFRKDAPAVYGAWEHSYGSSYFMPEKPMSENGSQVVSFASHEFFHVVTPLNIHSEIIEKFNFETPIASKHLWLYEGTTEWASHMMQIRGGMIDDGEFLKRISEKLVTNDYFKKDLSLTDLSLGSFDQWSAQYGNVYVRGALTAMFLDMRLLELSKGKTGLNDVVKKLSKKYGPKKAFPEKEFFGVFTEMTYPEVRDFFRKYIEKAEPLPIKEYLSKAGYDYFEKFPTGKAKTDFGTFGLSFSDTGIVVTDLDPKNAVNLSLGLHVGDKMVSLIYQEKTTPFTDPDIVNKINGIKQGETFSYIVNRSGRDFELKGVAGTIESFIKHHIVPVEKPSAEQLAFRKSWLTNQP